MGNLFAFIPAELLITFAMCLLSCLGVAISMRFFVKPILQKLDEYFEARIQENARTYAIYKTVKSALLFVVAGLLTARFLAKLMDICVFPADGNKALFFIYFIPMYAVQWFLDVHMKKLACKVFGIPYVEDEKKEKAKKPRIFNVGGERYVKNEAGELVRYEEE